MVEGAETLNRALLEGLTPDEARDVGRVVGEELASADASVRAFLVTLVAAAWALRRAERDGEGGIRSFGDALWCAFNALTTTGESGCPPVTGWGRVVAGALMLVGTPMYAQVQNRVARMVGRLAGGESASPEGRPTVAPQPVSPPAPPPEPWTFAGATAASPADAAPPAAPASSAVLDALLERVKVAGDLMARTQGLVMKVDAAATANRHLLERVADRAAATEDVEGKLDAILELLRQVSAALPQSAPLPSPSPSSPPSHPSPPPSLSPLLAEVIRAAAIKSAAAAKQPNLPSSSPPPPPPPSPVRPSLAEQLRVAAGPLAAAAPPPSSPPQPSTRSPKGKKQKRRRK